MDGDFRYKDDVVNDAIIEAINRDGHGAQARLAQRLGESPQTINKWYKRLTTPNIEKWPEIEDALGLEPGTFFTLVMGTDAIKIGWNDTKRRRAKAQPEPTLGVVVAELRALVADNRQTRKDVDRLVRLVEALAEASTTAPPPPPSTEPPRPAPQRHRPGRG